MKCFPPKNHSLCYTVLHRKLYFSDAGIGRAGGATGSPIFGRSVNPTPTGLGLSPPITTGTPNKCFSPSGITVSTYILDVLWGQGIKLIQVASNSEFRENQWNNLLFFEIVSSHCFGASEASKIDRYKIKYESFGPKNLIPC